MARRILAKFEGGSTTADFNEQTGSLRLTTRIGGKTEREFRCDVDETEKLTDFLSSMRGQRREAFRVESLRGSGGGSVPYREALPDAPDPPEHFPEG